MPLRAPRGFISEDDPAVAKIGHPAPPWLVNYADLMTEMVAFFVILYALGAALDKNMVSAKDTVEKMMQEQKIEGKVEMTKEGLKITLQESEGKDNAQTAFFESGKADLTAHMCDIIDRMSPELMKLALKNHEIVVEGHTDNIPISEGYFRSNWELSTARSTVVVRYLIDQHKFPPGMAAAIGYGEFRPVAPNDSDDNRRKNRRVVFFVKNAPVKFEPKEMKE